MCQHEFKNKYSDFFYEHFSLIHSIPALNPSNNVKRA